MSTPYTLPAYATPGPVPPDQFVDASKGMEMERGVKRKIAGWTAPPDSFTPSSFLPTTTSSAGTEMYANGIVTKQEPQPLLPSQPPNEPITETIKTNPSRTTSPIPVPVEEPHPARMGTRLPGSGDLANTGARTRTWPRIPGVHVGQVISDGNGNVNGDAERQEEREGREEVVEEECYSWADLPMNKQGESERGSGLGSGVCVVDADEGTRSGCSR